MIDWDSYIRDEPEHEFRDRTIMLEDIFITHMLPFVPPSSIAIEGVDAAINFLTNIECMQPCRSRQAAGIAVCTALALAMAITQLQPKRKEPTPHKPLT